MCELEGDQVGIGVDVGRLLGEDMPDDHQQLARQRDDGLVRRHAAAQPLELGAPVGAALDGAPHRFDQHRAQFLAALLGDMTGAVRLSAIVHARAETAVADQLFGVREAGDGSTAPHVSA